MIIIFNKGKNCSAYAIFLIKIPPPRVTYYSVLRKYMKDTILKELLESGEIYIFPPCVEKVTGVDKDGVVYAGLCISQELLDLINNRKVKQKGGE